MASIFASVFLFFNNKFFKYLFCLFALQHIMVVEFESAESVDDVRAEATYLNRNQVIPTNSPIMWFRKVPIKTVPQNDKEQIKLNITRTTPMLSKKQLSDLLMSAESVKLIFIRRIYNCEKKLLLVHICVL